MSKPSVGRIVLVMGGAAKSNGADVAPAVITRVWSDEMVNVTVFPDAHERAAQPETSINLYETEDEAREALASSGRAAYWPPRV